MHRPIFALIALLACGARTEAAPPLGSPVLAPGAKIPAQPATAAPASHMVRQAPVLQVVPARPPPLVAYRPLAEFALPGRTLLRDAVVLTGAHYSRALVLPAAGTYQVTGTLTGNTDAVLSVTPTARTAGRPTMLALQSPAANAQHAASLAGQRTVRVLQVTPQQFANGARFVVSVIPVAATLAAGAASRLSFEIAQK
jgi:hypothetical protein